MATIPELVTFIREQLVRRCGRQWFNPKEPKNEAFQGRQSDASFPVRRIPSLEVWSQIAGCYAE